MLNSKGKVCCFKNQETNNTCLSGQTKISHFFSAKGKSFAVQHKENILLSQENAKISNSNANCASSSSKSNNGLISDDEQFVDEKSLKLSYKEETCKDMTSLSLHQKNSLDFEEDDIVLATPESKVLHKQRHKLHKIGSKTIDYISPASKVNDKKSISTKIKTCETFISGAANSKYDAFSAKNSQLPYSVLSCQRKKRPAVDEKSFCPKKRCIEQNDSPRVSSYKGDSSSSSCKHDCYINASRLKDECSYNSPSLNLNDALIDKEELIEDCTQRFDTVKQDDVISAISRNQALCSSLSQSILTPSLASTESTNTLNEQSKLNTFSKTEESSIEMTRYKNVIRRNDGETRSDCNDENFITDESDTFLESTVCSYTNNAGKSDVPEQNRIEDDIEEIAHLLEMDDAVESWIVSPVKRQPKFEAQSSTGTKTQEVERIGKDSYCSTGMFGRHLVISAERNSYSSIVTLNLRSLSDDSLCKASLRGMWSESYVKEGDIVHIFDCPIIDGQFTLNDEEGMLVVNPDLLLSGTSIVSGCFCRRKAILNELFRGIERTNQVMLVGSLVHQLFQEVVKVEHTLSIVALDQLLHQLLQQSWVVRDLYGFGIAQEIILAEMKSFLPHIRDWCNKYKGKTSVRYLNENNKGSGWTGVVNDIDDIEENFWSPRFGLKGKVDLTVKVTDASGPRTIPLELKTGRATFSSEHKGQVILYCMMSGDRRLQADSGLLLYLREGQMEEVKAGVVERAALLQMRNEMAHYLCLEPTPTPSGLVVPKLPAPLDSRRGCSSCSCLLPCCALQEPPSVSSHAMTTLIPETLAHLPQNALEFFRHWCLLLHLELSHTRRSDARALWCQSAAEREASGIAVCFLRLITCEQRSVGHWLHSFARLLPCEEQLNLQGSKPPDLSSVLPTNIFKAGDMVVVSSKTCIAIAQGIIHSVSVDTIVVALERDLRSTSLHRSAGHYHIDACQYSGGLSHSFTGLLQLMMDSERAAALRRLFIDHVPGVLKAGLTRAEVAKCRHILRPLNNDQQRAVLRSILCQDYTLIKGYPGTGKSVCVVALVQVLVLLGQSVLLTAYTHSALDNILLKLKETEVQFLRLGRVSRIHMDLLDHSDELLTESITSVTQLDAFYASKQVIASTCMGVNHVIFTRRHFDVCIVDEAAQVSLPVCLSSLLLADKFILVGDSKQLPPLVHSKQARELGACESAFSVLEQNGVESCCASLTLQYRMNGAILRLANALMYENRLRCASHAVEHAQLLLPHHQEWSARTVASWERTMVSSERAVMWLDTTGTAPHHSTALGLANHSELELVSRIVTIFLLLGVPGDEVGIITPYRAQVKLLSDALVDRVLYYAKVFPDDWPKLDATQLTCATRRVEINTVDQYQGRDKSLILYSCVRSGMRSGKNGNIAKSCEKPLRNTKECDSNAENTDKCDGRDHHAEILSDDRRLNVSITRAKHKLVMVGDVTTLRQYKPFAKLFEEFSSDEMIQLKRDGECDWAGACQSYS